MADADDHGRFAEVFLPHLNDAYRLARWLTGSRADAEDIVQDAALRAFQGVARFGGANPRAWVLTIVRNAAYGWLARNRPASLVMTEDLDPKNRATAEAGEPGSVPTPEMELIAKVEAKALRDRVAALPPPFREVLVLREINELSYHEIAAVAGIPVGTVMSRLARARRMLVGEAGKDGS